MDALIIFCLLVIGIAVSILFFLFSSKVGAAKAGSDVLAIKEIRTFNLSPGDVLVVKFSGRMGPEIRDSLKEQLSNVLPSGIKTLVIDEYLDIDTVLKCESSEVERNVGENK